MTKSQKRRSWGYTQSPAKQSLPSVDSTEAVSMDILEALWTFDPEFFRLQMAKSLRMDLPKTDTYSELENFLLNKWRNRKWTVAELRKHLFSQVRDSYSDTQRETLLQRGSAEPKVFEPAALKAEAPRKRVSVKISVLNTLRLVCEGVGVSPTSIPIVESFIWCFLARKSNGDQLFSSNKEYGRFVQSMKKTAKTIKKYETKDCREQSFCKYWLDYYLAAGFEDDNRPVREEWMVDPLFSGWCKLFIARAVAHRDLAFLYSLQKGSKQMWPPLKEENMRKAILKSIGNLTVAPPPSPESSLKMIAKVAGRILGNISYKMTDVGKRFMPSSSACLQASRLNGGALSLYAPLVPPTTQISNDLGFLRSLDLCITEWRQNTFADSVESVASRLINEGGKLHTEERGIENERSIKEGALGDAQKEMEACRGFQYESIFDVSFVGLFEPGKIRGISIGDGYLATALQPIQGLLLSAWKSTKWSTMLVNDLTDTIREIDSVVDEPYWCSGDYEAATDKMHKDASLAALGAMPDHPLKQLGLLSFSHGRIEYTDPSEENFRLKPAKRTSVKYPLLNGQLMGHTLSFPLLCIINLAVLELSIKMWIEDVPIKNITERVARGRRGKIILAYAKINGDDVLFKGDLELFKFHRIAAESVGFKISQGKNYFSRHSCLINSQLFTRRNGTMVRVGYLNLRLIKGNNIKGATRALSDDKMIVDPTHIGKELNRMASLTAWTASAIPAAFDRWEAMNRDFKWFRPNWFLPVHLGGYGIDPKFGSDYKITKGQRLLAAIMVNNPDILLYRQDGLQLPTYYKSKIVPTIQVKPGDFHGPLESHMREWKDIEDSWTERLAYAERASHLLKVSAETTDFEVFLRAQRIKRQTRLKPLSDNGMQRYWNVRVITNLSSKPAPVQSLKLISEDCESFPVLTNFYNAL